MSNLIVIPFSENLTPTSYTLPEGLEADEWLDVGRALGRVRGSTMWWIGDWWNYSEAYGDRVEIIRSNEWQGPSHETCRNAGWVCERFKDVSSRDDTVSFRVHQAIAPIPDGDWRLKVLAWAATVNDDDRRPTIAAIEERVREVKALLAQGWTADQLDRKARAQAGQCVVANIREDNGRRTDEALLSWAEAESRFVRIDRKTDWGNPFEMPKDGQRAEVVSKFAKFYLPHKNGLLCEVPNLAGKVLGCWCHPEECHGHIIAEVGNRVAAGEGTVEEITNKIADADG